MHPYDFTYLSAHETNISQETSVESRYGSVPADQSFTVGSFLFWAKDGYLKLDYTANPEAHAFWNRYDKPDPTFIRPWADGHCNSSEEDKTDFSQDVDLSPYYVNPGETVTISATVRNFSNVTANDVKVRFYLGDPDDGGQQIGADQIIPTLSRSGTGPQTVSIEWAAEGRGKQRIYAVIDPDNELAEIHDEVSNVNNNKGYNYIGIGATEYVDPGEARDRDYYGLTYSQGSTPANRLHVADQTQTTFDAHIPLTNLEEVVLFEFVSPESIPASPTGTRMIGDPVALVAYNENVAQESFDLKPAPGTPPGVITVQYSEADLRGTAEEDLRLYTWTGEEWAEPSCAGHTLQHMVEDNMFIVPICETGTFALFGEFYNIYLPIIVRS